MARTLSASVEKATAYCTYCPKLCRFSCPAAEAENRETVTPWALMRLLEYVRTGDVAMSEEVAEIFYHCMGCRRCQQWCKHENDVPQAMWAARALLREAGYVPDALAGFEQFFLEENSPHPTGRPLKDVDSHTHDAFDPASSIVFMPDCETRFHYPEIIARAGHLIEAVEGRKARLHTRDEGAGHACCGFPLLSAGDEAGYLRYRDELEDALADAEYVITDCAAMAALYREASSFGRPGPLNVLHVVEWLSEMLDSIDVPHPVPVGGLKLHDSCFVTRQLQLGAQTRDVLAHFLDGELGEFAVHGDDAPCCGGASHYHVVARDASERCASDRLSQLHLEGGDAIVCGSATCKKAFRRVGGDGTFDLLEIVCRAMGV